MLLVPDPVIRSSKQPVWEGCTELCVRYIYKTKREGNTRWVIDASIRLCIRSMPVQRQTQPMQNMGPVIEGAPSVLLSIIWVWTPKIDRATGPFLKSDRETWALVKIDM